MALAGNEEAIELLLIEEADAWFEYLEATRGQSQTRYGELEPWAWARLSQRLRAIRARRSRLQPAIEAPAPRQSADTLGTGLCQGFSHTSATRARLCL